MKENGKKHLVLTLTSLLLCAVVVFGIVVNDFEKSFVTIDDENTPLASGRVLVEQTDADIHVIPDKYNTGCKGELTKVPTEATTINDIKFKLSGDNLALDFYYLNNDKEGSFTFDNLDFSESGLVFLNEIKVTGKKINITFNNCKFSIIRTGLPASEVFSYVFNNCSIESFSGSNASFAHCFFGHTYKDGINPFQNVTVTDSYFADLASSELVGKSKHSDGIQMYGNKDAMVRDIYISHCRFEIPAVQMTGDTAAVNACYMVQLEYSDATNVHASDCIVNGGGYTIYATKKYDWISISDVSIDNFVVGSAKLFGSVYPKVADGISINNLQEQDSLYVTSVWKDKKGTHVIVSNDTANERTLKVITSKNEYSYSVGACLGGKSLRYDNFDMPFESFPFDVEIIVPEQADYIVCYDATTKTEKQIRFVNWTTNPVYLGEMIADDAPENGNVFVFGDTNLIFNSSLIGDDIENADNSNDVSDEDASGKCGKGLSYVLLEDGVLLISGQGEMDNYNSAKQAPWAAKINEIRKVIFDEGVTYIGSQSFKKAKKLTEVVFASSVQNIGANAFNGCSGLRSMSLSNTINTIGKYAFSGTGLTEVLFQGSEAEWHAISIGDYNEPLADNVVFAVVEEPIEELIEEEQPLLTGICGDGVSFSLSQGGELTISGLGEMNNFDSSKPAPWNEYMDSIRKVVIGDGVTSVGNQCFKKATNLTEAYIADTVVSIGSNSFIGCSALNEIKIGKNVTIIGKYAFSGTGLTVIFYEGSEEDFTGINVGDHNEKVFETITYLE